MPDDAKQIAAIRLPPPEFCGFSAEFEDNNLVVHIRKAFDKENKGRGWARTVIEAYTMPLDSLIIDFGRNEIISSTVYAGLVEIYQGFNERCERGVHLRNCSDAIARALKMLHIDSFFTITLQGS